jgi:hypothetical protein
MIVIPMMGKSSRFFSTGYDVPKYMLPLGRGTVFTHALSSFRNYFNNTPFLFLVRPDFNTEKFVRSQVESLGILNYKIIVLLNETSGQADTVIQGVRHYTDDTPLIIFNIDSIRHDFIVPDINDFGDCFLEVFKGHGDSWSFVKLNKDGNVIKTTEKIRISNLCSNGLYGFAKLGDFRTAFKAGGQQCLAEYGEIYIAPLYNVLVNMGLDVRCIEIPITHMEFCGTPDEYETLAKKLSVSE